MIFKVEFSGTPEQFILLAQELSEGGLDSLDMGDAMGYFISRTMEEYYEFDVFRDEFELRASIVFDSFQWKTIPIDFNFSIDPSTIDPDTL